MMYILGMIIINWSINHLKQINNNLTKIFEINIQHRPLYRGTII